ncbi:complex I subunit 5 family protein [Pseudobdellovibrio exovorus]|uniref:NADH dehydrogenase n=1 Tax=Pseudobdellovibrio exovorus JSS TaxID=1184267 RepID=M4VMS6_9BACT|nr:proton-conducting transporter membrane subunit [Pseudobdellovibrio exovorus]AGH94389.1 NADH dehydrogenase [Pseudobdellovibrio exovorus JSS]
MATYPVLLALGLAVVSYLVHSLRLSPKLMVLGSFLQLLLASWLVYLTVGSDQILHTALGGWSAPFGISFYIDSFSALMIWISALLFFVVHLYSLSSPESTNHFWAHNVCWFTLGAGVFGAFSTNDLFNLFVWFEVLLLSSYVLFAWSFLDDSAPDSEKKEGRKGLISYIILNILGSSVFLFGLALLYSSTGTLNFADLMTLEVSQTSSVVVIAGFCLVFAFSMKAGFFPLFNWLPASYPFGPISSVSLFAGLLTKVGIYALARFFLPLSALQADWIPVIMMVVANLTMLLGVYGAATHQSLRAILSFHIVSQVGYMALGFAVGTTAAISATIFYLLHHMVVKTNLFLISGVIIKIRQTDELKPLGGLMRTNPWLAAAFAISAMSLAGLPPLSGFWAKFFVLYSAAQAGAYWGLGVGLFVGLFTVYSMLKIWNKVFLKESPENVADKSHRPVQVPLTATIAILILTLWTAGLGLYPAILTHVSDLAAAQLMDTQNYLKTLTEVSK